MAKTPEQIINEQVARWNHHQSDASRKGNRRTQRHWPIITVSREFQSHGDAVSEILGRRTGFAVWDKELLHAIAEDTGADERLLVLLDEHRRKSIDDAVHSLLVGVQSTNLHYLRGLARVVRTLAAHGKSIIVGRGAHYLCDPALVLRLRIVCPVEQRVRTYAREKNIDERMARRVIEQMDMDQADFIRHHFHREITLPSDYDLVVNAGVLNPEQMADLTLQAYEMKIGACPVESA